MIGILLILPFLISAIVLHEVAHGWVANRLGDPTAKNLGRLSLNPLRHVSWTGSVLVPALLMLSRAPFLFAWAKPVPIDARNFRNPQRDMGWVAIAGPAVNFLLAVGFAGIYRLLVLLQITAFEGLLETLLIYAVRINLVLGIFNLFPIPPLDGGRIVSALLPPDLARGYGQLERFGLVIVIGFLAFGLFDYLSYPILFLQHLLLE